MAKTGIVNFYAALEVGEEADEAAVKKSYRNLVLKWHPDKNPTDREKAEERIRLINVAYATLSNPTKREKYDLQRCAVDKKQRGVAPAKPKVSPKMSVPKEFMMQPLGHPEKFVRYEGKKTSVQARQDVQAGFEDFFQSTKFSLWWLPEVNNMCRVRALGSKARGDRRGAAAGLAGGLNLSFRVSPDAESEVLLAAAEKGKRSETVDFVAKESPEYEGAFRFETACRRGHYLAFLPPSDLRVVAFLNEEQGRVLDFMPVDFSATLKFKDLEEVLLPLALPSRGSWLPLAQLRESKDVAAYFQKVLQKPLWDAEDFAAYFEGHWTDWEYRAADEAVRLRPLDERLGQVLRSAQSAADIASAVLGAGEEELSTIALPGALRAIQLLGGPADGGRADESPGAEAERRKLLKALPAALTAAAASPEAAPLLQLLDAAERLPGLVGAVPTPDALERRKAAVRALLNLIVARLVPPTEMAGDAADVPPPQEETVEHSASAAAAVQEAPKLRADELVRLLRLPGVAAYDGALRKVSLPALEGAGRETQLQVLQRAVSLGCDGIADAATVSALATLDYAEPDEGANVVVALARAGARTERLAAVLRARATFISAPALAAAVLALSDRSATSEALRAPAVSLASKAPLTQLSPETLLALGMAANKIQSLGLVLNAVASAAAAGAQGWTAGDLIRLVLALARGKEHILADVKEALVCKVGSVVIPQLASLPVAELVKATLGFAGFGAAALLEAAAKEAVIRLPDLSLPQLLLVTQGLAQGLGPGHQALHQVLDFWPGKLRGAPAPAAAGEAAPDAAGELSPDQLIKLLVAATPALRTGEALAADTRRRFVQAVGGRLVAREAQVPEACRALLIAELAPEGCLGGFTKREELRSALRRGAAAAGRTGRARSRSRSGAPAGGRGEGPMPAAKKKKRKR